MAPSKSSDVDNGLECSWDSDEGTESPTMELEVRMCTYVRTYVYTYACDCHVTNNIPLIDCQCDGCSEFIM